MKIDDEMRDLLSALLAKTVAQHIQSDIMTTLKMMDMLVPGAHVHMSVVLCTVAEDGEMDTLTVMGASKQTDPPLADEVRTSLMVRGLEAGLKDLRDRPDRTKFTEESC